MNGCTSSIGVRLAKYKNKKGFCLGGTMGGEKEVFVQGYH